MVERHYGPTQTSASGAAVKEVYLSLSDGEHLDGPAELGTTGFFWDYTPVTRWASAWKLSTPAGCA